MELFANKRGGLGGFGGGPLLNVLLLQSLITASLIFVVAVILGGFGAFDDGG